jgi:hypothetical protein
MKRLSSYSSFVNKYVMPVIVSAMGAVVFKNAKADDALYSVAAMLGAGLAWLLWWAQSIRFVSTDGEQFLISDLRRRILVPVSQLQYWTENRMNRTPSICLYFDPPTEFGRKIRLIPPTDFLSRKRFDAVIGLLEEITGRDKQDA